MENNINNGNPWKGLSSYTYQDADRFYGRDQELKDIASIIKQNAFTTLYGISGAGKTSIINAGLFPLLDKQSFLPIYIRLDHNAGHVPYDMQIIKAVDNALDSIGAEPEDIIGLDIESELDKLWLYFHSHRFWSKDNHVINPIIFIDQFEEIFTKNDDTDNIWSFFNIIDSLQYSTPTERILNAMENADQFVSFGEEQNFRMVFSMREDFLARLEDYSYNIPALRKNRIGLKPLNGLQALEVILKPCPDMVNRKVALHIISKVVGKMVTDNERKLEATSVDTSILSLFCTELYNYAMSDNKGEISIPLVDLYGGNILEWFYDRNMQILPKQTYIYLENQLLTHSGFRNSVALENLLENGVLQEQLDLLAENRIIRIEDVNHNLRVEFTHDVLCRIAKKRKDERDKLEKMKGEQAARKAFTIDNIILFSVFTFGLLAINYVGFDASIVISLLSLPFIIFLYMIIANRTVADKNLSNTIWFIIMCYAIEGILSIGVVNLEDTLKSKEAWANTYDSLCISVLSFLPLGIILMPFAVLCKIKFSNGHQLFKSMKRSAFIYMAVLLLQSLLIYFWHMYFVQGHKDDVSYYLQYLPYFLVPTIILALSPFYLLWQNKKNHESMFLSGCTAVYTLYIALCIITIWAQSEYRILPSSNSDGNLIAIGAIWVVIGILCAFYAIQYMKQPKQQSFTNYYRNVLSFQSFTKYKSFKTRLFTIMICFAIFMMGVIATRYIDIVPIFTLPIATVLTLYIGCSEFELTMPKTVFSFKVIAPIIILTEIIVGCQYVVGMIKIIAIFVSALLIVSLVFFYLIYKEVLHNRKLFALKVFVFSIFVGFLLPRICLGYNIFNTSLAPVSRVWDGRISSNVPNLFFVTIKDDKGDFGVMDYSEILISPKYQAVSSPCIINNDIFSSIYSYRKILMDLLDVRDYYALYKYSLSSYVKESEILCFNVKKKDGTNQKLTTSYFLELKNKYGEAYVNSWLPKLWELSNSMTTYAILNRQNKNITDKERDASIVRIFIKNLVNEYPDDVRQSFLKNIGLMKYDVEFIEVDSVLVDSVFVEEKYVEKKISEQCKNEIAFIAAKCYKEISLEYLLKASNVLSLEYLSQASVKSACLFVCDKNNILKTIILDKLWDKLHEDYKDNSFVDERAYLYLLSGDNKKAEIHATSSFKRDPQNINALCNLCLSLYLNEKRTEMDVELAKFNASNSHMSDKIVLFYDKITDRLLEMGQYNLVKKADKIAEHIAIIIRYDNTIILQEKSAEELNSLAYEYARELKFDLAMLCIEKAISSNPKEANYFDSKGEILLMQGKEDEALEMWKKVVSINPHFLKEYSSSVLHERLLERGLIYE